MTIFIALFHRPYAEIRLKQVRERFDRLPLPHREMLPGYLEHCEDVCTAVDRNWEFVKALTQSSVGIFENSEISKVTNYCSGDMRQI